MSFSKIILSGQVVSAPEKRFTPNNVVVCNFNISVPLPSPSRTNNDPFVVRITCWRNLAEAATTQLQQGDFIQVEGKLTVNSFQTQEGVQKKVCEVEAASLEKIPGEPVPVIQLGEGSSMMQSPKQSPSVTDATSQNTGFMQQQSDRLPVASAVSTAASPSSFSADDLLTEDDIPF
ncbi:MAG: single-stranded DNA-binding protein [Cyanobacteria bacterium P01_H01_bin.74]